MVLWFTWEMVWGGKVPFFRDLGPYFYPMRYSLAQSFRAGELPLWNRYMAMGFPLLADFQSGTFYPPHLLYLALPFWTAVRAIFVLHFFYCSYGGLHALPPVELSPILSNLGGYSFHPRGDHSVPQQLVESFPNCGVATLDNLLLGESAKV